ncbi:hypothetical protein SteCoe_35712 [Stentor coeruleus]|uniref:Phytanoyl-CoA dioxygenase n=1 Tax=Stentor coeruleus TaxID=5963 RepID=A0A1R2ART7_9CILI|nr:hypothetical protein SteCoe_35712 [Stentor coeruleus]
MLLKDHPLVHLQWVWDIRQDPRIAELFSNIWNVNKEDLLVSFDAMSLHLPSEITGKNGLISILGIHTDQSNKKTSKCCIQSFVNLYTVNPGDATLFILENSHKYFNEYFSHIDLDLPDSNEEYIPLTNHGINFFLEKGCVPRWVQADEGTVVLWDSRVFHMGSCPIQGREEPNFRLVVYVCMLPRYGVRQNILDKKIKALEDKIDTSHWANCAILEEDIDLGGLLLL